MDNFQLHILQWNCHSVRNKLPTLRSIANDYDIILLSETWLNDVNNLHIPNFTTLRKDRTSSEHGGFGILTKSNITFLQEKNIFHQENQLETLGISIPLCSHTQEKLLIVSVYRPPTHNTTSHANWNKLLDYTNNFKYSLLGGDFNSHHTAWGSHRICKSGENLFDSITEHNLILLNDGTHTYYPNNQAQGDRTLSSSPLDLTLTSTNLSHLVSWNIFPDKMNSDHFPISIDIQLKP